MHLDEPDIRDRYYHSDSETDIDRRSLDLASSINSSDEDMYDPSDLKHLSVNDYPQYWTLFTYLPLKLVSMKNFFSIKWCLYYYTILYFVFLYTKLNTNCIDSSFIVSSSLRGLE